MVLSFQAFHNVIYVNNNMNHKGSSSFFANSVHHCPLHYILHSAYQFLYYYFRPLSFFLYICIYYDHILFRVHQGQGYIIIKFIIYIYIVLYLLL